MRGCLDLLECFINLKSSYKYASSIVTYKYIL